MTPEMVISPWESNPYRLWGLFEMLDHSAANFHRISSFLMKLAVVPNCLFDEKHAEEFINGLEFLACACRDMGLQLSLNQIQLIQNEWARQNLEPSNLQVFVQELHRRLYEELQSNVFRFVPKHKIYYLDPAWPADPAINASFPTTIAEFQKAGRCYAYGEDTACVFHLMRVVDCGLRAVAKSLSIAYDARSWDSIAQHIQIEMERKYHTKTDEWKKAEPFYAEILTDIRAIARGHRNPALHEIERNYAEVDSHYLLTSVEAFVRHLATKIHE